MCDATKLEQLLSTLHDMTRQLDHVTRQLTAESDAFSEDRRQISRLILLTQRLLAQADTTLAATERLEQTTVTVAHDLAAHRTPT